MALSPISYRPTSRAPLTPEPQEFRAKATPENSPVVLSLDSVGDVTGVRLPRYRGLKVMVLLCCGGLVLNPPRPGIT